MAGSVNKVILVGNVGSDPEVRSFSSGDQVVKFSLATSETWRDRNTGERKDRTEWHNIVIYNEGLIKVVSQYVKKGTKLYIEGQLQTRKWQDPQTNNDRYTTEIVLQKYRGELHMLDRLGDASGASSAQEHSETSPNLDQNTKTEGKAYGSSYDLDDEIPF